MEASSQCKFVPGGFIPCGFVPLQVRTTASSYHGGFVPCILNVYKNVFVTFMAFFVFNVL